jgi:hypothetical protein
MVSSVPVSEILCLFRVLAYPHVLNLRATIILMIYQRAMNWIDC